MTVFVNLGSVYLLGWLVSLIFLNPILPTQVFLALRLDHTLSAHCLWHPIISPRLQTERGGKWRGPLTARGRRDAGQRKGPSCEGSSPEQSPLRPPEGAAALAFPAHSRSLCRIHPGSGAAVCEPGGCLSPLLPARTTRCQGSSALLLGLGRGGSTIPFSQAGNVPNFPHAAVYKAPESAGGRSRIPHTVGSRPAPASGLPRPHEDPPAGAESRAPPGPRSGRGLRALARSVRWHVRQRASCGQERRRPRGAPRPPEGHRGRVPAGASAMPCFP